MKLATLCNKTRDGELVVLSDDTTRFLTAGPQWPSLQSALDDWKAAEPYLHGLAKDMSEAIVFPAEQALAPLPRAYQWLDASAYLNHGRLMQQAFNLPPHDESIPLMYQGGSDDFLSGTAPATFPSQADGIDFEAELGVIVDDVPMGTTAVDALVHVRLVVLINDWSLRALAPREMKAGFGFLQAKPATAFAAVAVTPDALGTAWHHGRLDLTMKVTLNGTHFGELDTGLIDLGFADLIAHAARTRNLRAGTIIGSGTISNASRNAGSACLSERRVIEMIDDGASATPFMKAGDRIRIEAFDSAGNSPFGAIDQTVVIGGIPGTVV